MLNLILYKPMSTWMEGREFALLRNVLPLSEDSHKGSSGRIAIIGGSARYTGAPFYAAMATLKTGADLSYIFTAHEAAIPIKCYSPELMVAPVYSALEMDKLVRSNQVESDDARKLVMAMVDEVVPSIERLHCLVIGPGLGRCPLVFQAVAKIVRAAREMELFMVFDADALYMLSQPEYRSLLRGYEKAVLTPNIVEYNRLFPSNNIGTDPDFDRAIIVRKGKQDDISIGDQILHSCAEAGGLKRSGGIGDILAGTIATLIAWHVILKSRGEADDDDVPLACWTACCFVKRATLLSFDVHERSMTAMNVLDELGPTVVRMTSKTERK